MKYACPCCGYKTLDEEPPGTYDICRICFWEDDGVQFSDPDYKGGANIPSLRTAQKNYLEFGACEERCVDFVKKPNENDEFSDPKDLSKIMRMPVIETILIFKEFNIPLVNILDLYLGFTKINNSNFVYSYEQLEELLPNGESTEYTQLMLRDLAGYENAIFNEIRNLSEDEARTRIRKIRNIFMVNLNEKYKDLL
jgi:hypothetical protein